MCVGGGIAFSFLEPMLGPYLKEVSSQDLRGRGTYNSLSLCVMTMESGFLNGIPVYMSTRFRLYKG